MTTNNSVGKEEKSPVDIMNNAVNALFLELPDKIAYDVREKWGAAYNYLTMEQPLSPQSAEGVEEIRKMSKKQLIDYIYEFAWMWGRFYHLGDAEKIKEAIVERFQLPEEFLTSPNKWIDKPTMTEYSSILLKEKGWNKVSEVGYPPHNKGVIVFIPEEDYHITSGMWDISKKWVLLDEYRSPDCEVTHWMESPKPPAEFEKEIQENYQVMKALKHLLKKDKP